MGGGIWQHRHMARILQRHREATLMLGAGACLAARLNLATIRDVATQATDIFVVNLAHMVNAKRADFAPRTEVASPPTKTWPVGTVTTVRAVATIRALATLETIRTLQALAALRAIRRKSARCVVC